MKNSKSVTAVEWLEKEIFRNYKFLLQKVDCTRLEESIEQAKEMEKQKQDEFAIGFGEWKDDNFLMYSDKTYYSKTSSLYFDVTKHVGREKPTIYYRLEELLEIFKKEKGL
jgi:ABC-type Fe3+-citrate transport system substrate-binding protein